MTRWCFKSFTWCQSLFSFASCFCPTCLLHLIISLHITCYFRIFHLLMSRIQVIKSHSTVFCLFLQLLPKLDCFKSSTTSMSTHHPHKTDSIDWTSSQTPSSQHDYCKPAAMHWTTELVTCGCLCRTRSIGGQLLTHNLQSFRLDSKTIYDEWKLTFGVPHTSCKYSGFTFHTFYVKLLFKIVYIHFSFLFF